MTVGTEAFKAGLGVGLCLCQVSFLGLGVSVLVLTSRCVGPGPRVKKLEGGVYSGTYKHQSPHGRSSFPNGYG